MTSQSYYGFNYLDEILRVSKNKAVCYRALIQNIDIQMQSKQDAYVKSPMIFNDDLEIVSQLIIEFIQNQNLSLRFLIDHHLGKDNNGYIGRRAPMNKVVHKRNQLSSET